MATSTDLTDLLNGATLLPTTIDGAELAALLGITRSALNKHVKDGNIPKAKRGTYELRAAVRAYTEHLRQHAAQAGRPTQGNDALKVTRIAKMEAETEIAEIKAAQARGELVDAKAVTREWETILTDIRAALLAIPGRLPGIDRDTMTRVDGEVRAVLLELADHG